MPPHLDTVLYTESPPTVLISTNQSFDPHIHSMYCFISQKVSEVNTTPMIVKMGSNLRAFRKEDYLANGSGEAIHNLFW